MKPRLHGLQVGVATYVVAHLQHQGVERVEALLDPSGFFDAIAGDPLSRSEFMAAVELAPTMKHDFYSVLSTRDVLPEVRALLDTNPRLARCFVR